jgi:hypothetical protein
LLKKEFPPTINWFEKIKLRVDLGFQGIVDEYRCEKVTIPHKRKRAKKGEISELTSEQKEYNKQAGKERIYVEHSIGGMKRYQQLVNRNRLKKTPLLDMLLGICAALWNFSIR